MNAIVKSDDVRKAVVDSLSNPSQDIARHVLAMAGANPNHIEKSITTGTGLVAYDLQAPAKNLTFSTAAAEAGQWASQLVAHDATLAASAGAVLSDVKQAASNAVDMADTALAAYILPASKAAETALESALAGATKGLTLPFNPLISDGVDRIAAAVKAEADAWALKTKASLAAPGAAGVAAPAAG